MTLFNTYYCSLKLISTPLRRPQPPAISCIFYGGVFSLHRYSETCFGIPIFNYIFNILFLVSYFFRLCISVLFSEKYISVAFAKNYAICEDLCFVYLSWQNILKNLRTFYVSLVELFDFSIRGLICELEIRETEECQFLLRTI